ncbi:hypothetical protein FACS1894172_09400 [Spirochaetia bacterium]|nr:hypothetical protein FACS1894172_09400 [Spirochaetia bacterium]
MVKAKLPPMPERQILRDCKEILEALGIWHVRINTGGSQSFDRKRFIYNGKKGCPDILAIHPFDGKTIGIECKRERIGKLSGEQVKCHNEFLASNAIYLVVHSGLELWQWLKQEGVIP